MPSSDASETAKLCRLGEVDGAVFDRCSGRGRLSADTPLGDGALDTLGKRDSDPAGEGCGDVARLGGGFNCSLEDAPVS